ncbi:MAG: hypothetical protein Q8P58_00075 [Candidatus Adlerbacteria bacterium]|nr:hypothetical protein [Candidatus Adlerbacteria bacterium]
MYVEFVGTPGAGKTTLVGCIRVLCKKEGEECVTRADFFRPNKKRMYKIVWTLLHLHYLDWQTFYFLWLLSRKRRLSFGNTAIKIHEHLKLQYQLSRRDKNVPVLWDAGFVQQFANLVILGLRSETEIVEFIHRRLPLDTLLVFLDTPPRETVKRKREREFLLTAQIGVKPKESAFSDEESHMLGAYRIYKNILSELARRNISTTTLDGMKSPEENAAVVYAEISRRMQRDHATL